MIVYVDHLADDCRHLQSPLETYTSVIQVIQAYARPGPGLEPYARSLKTEFLEADKIHATFKLYKIQGIPSEIGEARDTDLGQTLSPREQVGVVLVGTNKDHPSLLLFNGCESLLSQRGRDGDAHNLLQLLNRRSAAGSAKEKCVAFHTSQTSLDISTSFFD